MRPDGDDQRVLASDAVAGSPPTRAARRLKVVVYTAVNTIEVLDLAGSPVVKIQATGNVTGNGS